jgi:phosphate transport system permease protein
MNYAIGIHYNALFATAVVLFIVIISLLIIANHIQRKYSMDIGGGTL